MHLLLWHWMICLEVTSLLLSDTYCNQIERILFLVLHLCSDFIAALYSSFHVTQMWMAWCFFSTNVLVWYSFQSLNAVVWLECSIGLDCYYDSFSHCLKVRNHFCCTDYILSVSLSLSLSLSQLSRCESELFFARLEPISFLISFLWKVRVRENQTASVYSFHTLWFKCTHYSAPCSFSSPFMLD